MQKTLQALEPFLEKKKHGKTITLSIKSTESKELPYIIEEDLKEYPKWLS